MRRVLSAIVLIGLLVVLVVVTWFYQPIADWWQLRAYQPSARVAALAADAHLNDDGRRLFYLTDPEIDDKQTFTSRCPIREQSYTLGCFSSGRIYILDIDRPELEDVMLVTAAHEMLHMAYERLSGSERERVDAMNERFFAASQDQHLRSLIAQYERVQPGTRSTELHSLIPTQFVELPPDMEGYYSQYFTNRGAVAEAYRSYEAVFAAVEQRINSLQSSLSLRRSQLERYESQIQSLRTQIDELNARLESLFASGEYGAYNSLIPEQNSYVREYNGLVAMYGAQVNEYNNLVVELQAVVLEQSDLVESLDASQYQPLQR